MSFSKKLCGVMGAVGLSLLAAAPALAAPIKAPDAAAMAGMVNKGDVAWMLVSAALVLMMSVPGLALFYGGLVRTKNMLSILMQVFMIVSVAGLVWCCWGYSIAFTSGGDNHFFGGLSKAFLMGVDGTTYGATFSNNVYLPEFVFVVFQMTFAMITPALIVGAFAERVKFSSLIVFVVLWLTFIYFPMAHMVWYWAGPDFLVDAPTDYGLLWGWGALDFAGGTVVHINAGIAGLVGAIMVGKRVGFPKEPMPPHSLTMTMIGASLLWVGWFGFNAGSNLEANAVTGVAFINTMVATCAAAVSWSLVEQVHHGKASLLGAVTGAVAGLVAITPAAGFAAPMTSIALGFIVSPICYIFVAFVKGKVGYDDSLDVFGVHCIGGIVGAIGTGIVAAPSLGGQGVFDYTVFPAAFHPEAYSIPGQVWIQVKAVVFTLLFSGIGSAILYFIIDKTMGLRPSKEAEMEGLDLSSHGERAYNY
ncbi:ammonium transporter [Sphingobium indicum]|uniref:Ammonium transporter n=2 Tax=Sphingobium indicum TaxID=332055 RepID=A0A1L5BTA3_SPHIB|nr:ammonium transporter [Sphingobium indicum]APL96103.1 ammonia channel protein [Sphingobium indicum B90A]KEY99554.1 ammonia channel protein [Sphingomonas sp. BHC-A]NYI24130.1 Amt family ammonium transporter [Sphingobium indicum]RYL99158.1 ammonium transporter [Sphingobium indicum]